MFDVTRSPELSAFRDSFNERLELSSERCRSRIAGCIERRQRLAELTALIDHARARMYGERTA